MLSQFKGVYQSDSVMCVHIFTLLWMLLLSGSSWSPSRLLCAPSTAGPYQSPVFYTAVCLCWSQRPELSLPYPVPWEL